jgi:glutaminyl-peptide cyclotransferase
VPLARLNELECVDGWVYANVWGTDWIVKIETASGAVRGVIDASDLLAASEREGADVLNGIAFDPGRRLFLLTGKLWPALFAVELVAQ